MIDLGSFKKQQFSVENSYQLLIDAESDILKRHDLRRKRDMEISQIWEGWPQALSDNGFPSMFHNKVQALLEDVPDCVYKNMDKLYEAIRLLRELYQ